MKNKTYIYMNHRIRESAPKKPVIRAQSGQAKRPRTKEANCFEIRVWGRVIGRVVYDPAKDPSPSHHVKAWVEVEPVPGIEVVPV